jgi:hypothetical protein
MNPTISRSQFTAVQRRVDSARDAEAHAADERARALARWEQANEPGSTSAEFRRAQAAKQAHEQAKQELDEAKGAQGAALGTLAENGAGLKRQLTGEGAYVDGWQRLASSIDVSKGVFQASVSLGELMKGPPLAATSITPPSGLTAPGFEVEGITPLARDVRFLTPHLRSQQVDQGDLAIQSFEQHGSRAVSGAVERDPVATTEKAKLALGLELVTPPLKQLALIADGTPEKLFSGVQGLGDSAGTAAPLTGGLLLEWLRGELQYQLDLSLDSHVMSQLVASKPAFGLTGTGLITQIRNAVSAHRALGASPQILAVPPKTAVELDSLEDANKRPIFPLGVVGGASPLFGLTIVELQSEEHAPVLLDANVIGLTYFSLATLLVDPFSESKKNQVSVRLEYDVLFHVRDVSGCYVLSKEALK